MSTKTRQGDTQVNSGKQFSNKRGQETDVLDIKVCENIKNEENLCTDKKR